MNFDFPHRIATLGQTARLHLVMDIAVNDFIKELFENTDTANKILIKAREECSLIRNNIIQQLLQMNTPASLKLALEVKMASE
jgi:hypothetical protein